MVNLLTVYFPKTVAFSVLQQQISCVFHPVLHNISTTQDAKKLCLYLKFLTIDYLTYERMSIGQPTISPACKLCNAPIDSIEHVMVSCLATSEVRSRLFPELMNEVAKVQPMCSILQCHPSPSILTQFILDCTSFNLPDSIHIPMHNPGISAIYKNLQRLVLLSQQ